MLLQSPPIMIWEKSTRRQPDFGECGDLDKLADQEWHLYTAVFIMISTVVYFDGEIANSWTLDGESAGQILDLKAVATMKRICQGSNQAWG